MWTFVPNIKIKGYVYEGYVRVGSIQNCNTVKSVVNNQVIFL